MIAKEQIAHELAMIYMSNRYAIDISGTISGDEDSVVGFISTEHLPGTQKEKTKRVKTGEIKKIGPIKIEKKETVSDGYKVDSIFSEMVDEYYAAYNKFLELLESKENVEP